MISESVSSQVSCDRDLCQASLVLLMTKKQAEIYVTKEGWVV